MDKKNKYVITIGFNKNDEDHRNVAVLLNEKNRAKAQYIVKAVLAYEESLKSGEHIRGNAIDYEVVREYVNRAVEEYMSGTGVVLPEKRDDRDSEGLMQVTKEREPETEIKGEALDSILKSLTSFRNG